MAEGVGRGGRVMAGAVTTEDVVATEILGDPYTKGISLPRIPISRAAGRDSQLANLVHMRPALYTVYHGHSMYVPLYLFTGLQT